MDYSDLTDEELTAKIAELRSAYETTVMGGSVAVVAGEGRRMEYTKANSAGLRQMLEAATREKARRGETGPDGALLVEI